MNGDAGKSGIPTNPKMDRKMVIYAGTLIEGTHRAEDLIPAFLKEVSRRNLGWLPIMKIFPELGNSLDINMNVVSDGILWKDMEASDGQHMGEIRSEIVQRLIELLNEDLPDDYMFGTHEGDGSDFGYWKLEEGER